MIERHAFELRTTGRGLFDITAQVQSNVPPIACGLANVFVHHTSASLIVSENADPDVLRDLDAFFARLVPDGDAIYAHTAEGPDDMPGHVRAALTATSISLPIRDARCDLGTWQAIYLWEHRHRAHRRQITVTYVG